MLFVSTILSQVFQPRISVLTIFLTVMLGVLTIGYLYDQVFSLWTEWRCRHGA